MLAMACSFSSCMNFIYCDGLHESGTDDQMQSSARAGNRDDERGTSISTALS